VRSIRVRIALAFLLAVASMGGVQAWLVLRQGSVADTLALVTEGYLPLAQQVARLGPSRERIQRDLARLDRNLPRPRTGEASATYVYAEELRDDLAIARIRLGTLQARSLPAAEQAVIAKALVYLDEIEAGFATYEADSVAYLARVEAGAAADALDADRRALRGVGRRLDEAFDKLAQTLDGRVTALTRATEQMQARTTVVAAAAGSAAVAASLVLLVAVLVALRPIGRLTAEVQRLAEGARGARVDVGGADEIGLLAAEFNTMAGAIEERDRRLTERAEELDRLSAHLASVVDAIDEGLVVVQDGLVTLTNPAATRAFGVTVGVPAPERLAAALAPGASLVDGPDGSRLSVRTVPFGAGVVAVLSDISEEVRGQERLARSERLALVGQMLAQITHEVRNPLNALSLNTELLGDELAALDPGGASEAGELLRMIQREVERLTDVTGHYLQLARRPPAQPAPLDLVALVADVERLLRPEVEAQGARLAVEGAVAGPVDADGNQLRQALLNVVRNAVEAGARRVVATLVDAGDTVRIDVVDDGPGLSDEALAHATDPFFSTKATGTGLGLAITRQILEDHDGTVTIATEPGMGTTVSLVLPKRRGPR
jgi:signal transduction histidine kinase